MASILIIYGSTEGQTARLLKGDRLPPDILPDTFDAVIIGASVHYGRFQGYIKTLVKTHLAALNNRPSAFFSVSGAAGSQKENDRIEAAKTVGRFLEQTGWRPIRTATFAGAVVYTRYSPLKRWVMKRIMQSSGRDTDTSRDFEYTDWPHVEEFAEEFAASLETAAAPRAVEAG